MDRMHLEFGCFDFAMSKETGEPVFLECNPNGQWLWLEKETGAPISRAIATSLANFELRHSADVCHDSLPEASPASDGPKHDDACVMDDFLLGGKLLKSNKRDD